MKEDLLNLKKELELKCKKYVPIDVDGRFAVGGFDSTNFSEIEQLEDTDGFIERFEDFAKDIIRKLVATGIPFDVITFISIPYFLCDVNCKEKLDKIDDYKKRADFIISNSCLKYVPIKFGLLRDNSGFYKEDGSFCTLCDSEIIQANPNFKDKLHQLDEKKVFAIVDFDKFIQKMKDNGYTVELCDIHGYDSVENASSYISRFKNFPGDTSLILSVNFNPEKSNDVELKR